MCMQQSVTGFFLIYKKKRKWKWCLKSTCMSCANSYSSSVSTLTIITLLSYSTASCKGESNWLKIVSHLCHFHTYYINQVKSIYKAAPFDLDGNIHVKSTPRLALIISLVFGGWKPFNGFNNFNNHRKSLCCYPQTSLRERSKQSNVMFSVRERLHGTTDNMNIICWSTFASIRLSCKADCAGDMIPFR